jgi:probable F420-dependent oxidoreductase
MRFGLFHTVQWPEGTNQRERYRDAFAQVDFAEAAGFEAVWFTEHHFSRHGITPDSLTLLAYLAARTERIRLGTAVLVLPFHDPVRLAEQAATVDLLSNGRLEFGIGRGYQWTEFHGFAVPMEERPERFDEAIDVIVRAWTAEAPFSHRGQFWSYDDATVHPKPLQEPHPPISLATASREGLERCAREGWGVLLPQGQSLEMVEQHLATYKTALAEVGRPYDPSRIVLARALYVAENDTQAWHEVQRPYEEFLAAARKVAMPPDASPPARNPFDTDTLQDVAVFGGPDACTATLKRIADLGIERVIFFVNMGGLPHAQIMGSLQRFASEVMPRVEAHPLGRS